MRPVWNFGNEVLNLPAAAREYATEAGALELQVLLLLTDPGLRGNGKEADDAAEALGKKLGCSRARAVQAMSFWMERGVLSDAEDRNRENGVADSVGKTEKISKEDNYCASDLSDKSDLSDTSDTNGAPEGEGKKLRRDDALPNYTTEELTGILERRKETAALINACEQTWGKIFNTHEVNQILGLTDYLCLDGDYVLELLSYAAGCERKSLRFVEKLAFDLYDEGVTDAKNLQVRLQKMRRAADFEGQVRSLFDLGHRALTTKEKKMLGNWNGPFNYGMDVVTRAYEVTVDATGGPAIPYANAVLERWNAEGLRTVEEIDKNLEERKNKGGSDAGQSGSFDTDDFFEAALRRSYGKDYERLGLNKVAQNTPSGTPSGATGGKGQGRSR